MIQITTKILSEIFPYTKSAKLELFVPHLNKYLNQYEINTISRIANFLAQTGHESGEYNALEENLYYSAEALERVFPKYFEDNSFFGSKAEQYEKKPEKIANYVYANRMGNGNEASGDGWKYRGIGLIQTTGKNNITSLSKKLGLSIDDTIKFTKTPEGAVKSACIFWTDNNLNRFADKNDIQGLTKAINGGLNGLDDRKRLTKKAIAALD